MICHSKFGHIQVSIARSICFDHFVTLLLAAPILMMTGFAYSQDSTTNGSTSLIGSYFSIQPLQSISFSNPPAIKRDIFSLRCQALAQNNAEIAFYELTTDDGVMPKAGSYQQYLSTGGWSLVRSRKMNIRSINNESSKNCFWQHGSFEDFIAYEYAYPWTVHPRPQGDHIDAANLIFHLDQREPKNFIISVNNNTDPNSADCQDGYIRILVDGNILHDDQTKVELRKGNSLVLFGHNLSLYAVSNNCDVDKFFSGTIKYLEEAH